MPALLTQRPMLFATFHQASRRFFRGERGKKSSFGHMFGDPSEYSGLVAFKGQPPVHVLFRLNLRDPAIGIDLPHVQWLPLLCAIRFGACALAYRVVSDNKVKIIFQQEKKAWDGFPYDGHPERLPPTSLRMKEGVYNADDPQSVLSCWGFFGISHLTQKQLEKVKRFALKKRIYDPEFSNWATVEEFLEKGVGWPFVQDPPPTDRCPNPRCTRRAQKASLRTFAIFEEEDKRVRRLWGPNCDSLQIIFQICPDCKTILTTNQCT